MGTYSFDCRGCGKTFEMTREGHGRRRTLCAPCYRVWNIQQIGARQKLLRAERRMAVSLVLAEGVEIPCTCTRCGQRFTFVRKGGKRITTRRVCGDCKAAKLAADKEANRKRGEEYQFSCQRCGASATASTRTKRKRFCDDCRRSGGGGKRSSTHCPDCGAKKDADLEKRCRPCRTVHERLRDQVKSRSRRSPVQRRVRRALAGETRGEFMRALLGYSVGDLRKHIERSFSKGMTWDAFSRGAIHIDHIIPLRAFDLESDDDLRRAWALTNLRPLWATENISKGGKVLTLV